MPGVPPNIPLAGWDVERRRLETTLDGDLSTLSLSSVPTVNSHISGGSVGASFISASSIERPRSAMVQPPSAWPSGMDDSFIAAGPSGTPRAAARRASGYDAAGRRHVSGASGISMGSMTSLVDSPKSTEGHHVSAMTLGGRLFRRNGVDMDDGSDFDPERSLGRLVGELGRVMSGNLAPRPASPFTHVLSPPRSPSPLPSHASKENGLNLSLTLTRADPLPSPPDSQGSNHSAPADETAHHAQSSAGFTSMARQLKEDLRSQPSQRSVPAPRRALSDSTTFNIAQAVPVRSEKTSKNRSTRDAHLRPPRAEQSAPAGSRRRADITSDITGMTGLMGTPAKGGAFLSIGRDGDVGGDAAGNIPQTLATLHARLRGLETEGSLARRRVRELEGELDRARGEVDEARRDGGARLQEVSGEKSALEELVNSLRSNLARLTAELESNKQLVLDLQSAQEALRAQPPTPPRPGAANELTALRREIERLSGEIRRLGGIVEQGLETRRKTREERTVRIDETILPDPAPNGPSAPAAMRSGGGESPSLIELDEEISAPQPTEPVAPSRLRQGLHASAVTTPTLMPPTVQPATRISRPNVPHKPSPLAQADDSPTTRPSTRMEKDPGRRASGGSSSEDGSGSNRSNRSDRSGRRSRAAPDGPSSPFPSIRAEDEADFFAQMEEPTPVRAKSTRCLPEAGKGSKDQQSARGARGAHHGSARPERQRERDGVPMDAFGAAALPPQTVLARVIAELEDDYAHYRSIYGELAEQYKLLDASGATNKRAILAQHLKEVIDTLEQKAGQIQALYSLLHFQDRPIDARSSHAAASAGVQVKGAPADVFRMVRETLGEEAVRRLEEDGVTMGRRRGARLV